MPNYLLAAAKATSTFCLLWSAFLLARSRPWLLPSNHPLSDIDSGPPRRRRRMDSSEPVPNESMPDESNFDGYNERAYQQATAPSTANANQSLLRHGWNVLRRFIDLAAFPIYSQTATVVESDAQVSGASPPTCTRATSEELRNLIEILDGLALKAGMPIHTRRTLVSTLRQIIPHFSKSSSPTVDRLLQSLVTYTRNDDFVHLLLTHDMIKGLVYLLANEALEAKQLAPPPSGTPSSGSRIEEDLSNSMSDMLSTTAMWPTTPDDSTSNAEPYDPPEYRLNLSVATIFANLSRSGKAVEPLSFSGVVALLHRWSASLSLRLILLASKISHNLEAHAKLDIEGEQILTSNYPAPPIYHPNVFRLDHTDLPENEAEFDIIFVNGMLGSVFFTWRQHDSILLNVDRPSPAYTKCWPRDWLAQEFPRARIIGVDAPLKPFIWNPICPMDRLKRTLDARSEDVMRQLLAAGVGRRPIIWVTHSAGGILVKEVLRLANKVGPSNQTSDDANSSVIGQLSPSNNERQNTAAQSSDCLRRAQSALGRFSGENLDLDPLNTVSLLNRSGDNWLFYVGESEDDSRSYSPPHSVRTSSVQTTTIKLNHFTEDLTLHETDLCDQTNSSPTNLQSQDRQSSLKIDTIGNVQSASFSSHGAELDKKTRGIVFISTPHRGSRSLFALYRFPLRWTLTPEAIQLERNSEALLDLHIWFSFWIGRSNVRVFTMAETRLTQVNRFWSVLLVPEDHRDRELGEIERIDSDHLYISKPVDPADPIYTSIVRFIRQTMSTQSFDDSSSH